MTSAKLLFRIANVTTKPTPSMLVNVEHPWFNYFLKLEKQGYIVLTKEGEGVREVSLTKLGYEHVEEMKGKGNV